MRIRVAWCGPLPTERSGRFYDRVRAGWDGPSGMLLNRPEVICTHESDLDGLLSGLLLQRLAKALFSLDVPIEAYNYQGWKARRMLEDVAWVADFAFDARFDRPGWLLVDHHTSSYTPRQARCLHDVGRSASKLCYGLLLEYGLGSATLERLVHLADVGDIFLESDPEFVLACDYAALVKAYGFWGLHAVIGGEPEALADHPLLEVMRVRRRIEDPIGYDLAVKDVVEISPTVALVRAPVGNSNLIVHQILNRGATPHPVVATLHRRGGGIYVASFRSLRGEALGVAQRFEGGGGHPNASGATLPKLQGTEAAIEYLRSRLAVGGAAGSGGTPMAYPFQGLQWPAKPSA